MIFVSGYWRNFGGDICIRMLGKIHVQNIQKFCPSADTVGLIKSETLSWEQHVAGMGAKRNAYRVLLGKPGRKKQIRRSKLKWKDNIKNFLKKQWDGAYWKILAYDRNNWGAVLKTLMNLGFT